MATKSLYREKNDYLVPFFSSFHICPDIFCTTTVAQVQGYTIFNIFIFAINVIFKPLQLASVNNESAVRRSQLLMSRNILKNIFWAINCPHIFHCPYLQAFTVDVLHLCVGIDTEREIKRFRKLQMNRTEQRN